MVRMRAVVSAASLVVFPLLILMYWLLYPAYGQLSSEAVMRSIDGHAAVTTLSDAFAFTGTFLAVPATLALMRLLTPGAPRLALIGGSLTLAGWIALVGVLMGDVVAVQIVQHGGVTPASIDLFTHLMNSPPMLALNVVALLHVVGGVVIGSALLRTRLVPRWAGVTATVTPVIHLCANLAGLLWIDALTWVALAAAYAYVARIELQASPPDARPLGG